MGIETEREYREEFLMELRKKTSLTSSKACLGDLAVISGSSSKLLEEPGITDWLKEK